MIASQFIRALSFVVIGGLMGPSGRFFAMGLALAFCLCVLSVPEISLSPAIEDLSNIALVYEIFIGAIFAIILRSLFIAVEIFTCWIESSIFPKDLCASYMFNRSNLSVFFYFFAFLLIFNSEIVVSIFSAYGILVAEHASFDSFELSQARLSSILVGYVNFAFELALALFFPLLLLNLLFDVLSVVFAKVLPRLMSSSLYFSSKICVTLLFLTFFGYMITENLEQFIALLPEQLLFLAIT